MNAQLDVKENRNYMHMVMIASAAIMTFFLFYIDEGFYDFRWMRDWSNWVVFVIYTSVLLGSQELIYLFVSRVYRSSFSKVLIVIIGLALGVWACFQIFSAM